MRRLLLSFMTATMLLSHVPVYAENEAPEPTPTVEVVDQENQEGEPIEQNLDQNIPVETEVPVESEEPKATPTSTEEPCLDCNVEIEEVIEEELPENYSVLENLRIITYSAPVNGSDVEVGGDLSYAIKIANVGDYALTDLSVETYIPQGTYLIASDNAIVDGSKVYWEGISLNPMSDATLTLSVKPDGSVRSLDNFAIVKHGEEILESEHVYHNVIDSIDESGEFIQIQPMKLKGMRLLGATPMYEEHLNKYDYTGGVQSFTAPVSGTYHLKVWGAAGGGVTSGQAVNLAGKGGFSEGDYYMNEGDTIYIIVGGRGTYAGSGSSYNGGGITTNTGAGGGGGMTHISTTQNVANASAGTWDPNGTLIVAGGGGGSDDPWYENAPEYGYVNLYDNPNMGGGGHGGGLIAGNGKYTLDGEPKWPARPEKESAGTGGTQDSGYAQGIGQSMGGCEGGSGGGGWWGGKIPTQSVCHQKGGGGGSGYIGGVTNGATSNGVREGNGYAEISWKVQYFKIDTSVTGGTITPSIAKLYAGDNALIEYAPNDDTYYLNSINVDGNEVDLDTYISQYAFNDIQDSHSIAVEYLKYRSITTEVVNGTINGPFELIKNGESRTVEYSGNEGYFLDYIELDGNKLVDTDLAEIENKYVFNDIQADHSIKVVYAPKPTLSKIALNEDGSNGGQTIKDVGDEVIYELSLTNPASTVKTLSMEDQLPKELILVGVSGESYATITEKDEYTSIVWEKQVQPGETWKETVTTEISDEAYGVVIQNVAVAPGLDPFKPDQDEVPVLEQPIKTVKDAGGNDINNLIIKQGEEIEYTISFTNPADIEKEFHVEDLISEELEFISASDRGRFVDGKVMWDLTLEGNQTKELTIKAKANKEGSFITNTVTVTVDEASQKSDPVFNFTPFKPVKEVYNMEDRMIDKLLKRASDRIYYTITVKNPSDLIKKATITDELPTEFDAQIISDEGKQVNGVVTWNLELQPKEEKTLRVEGLIKEGSEGKILLNDASLLFDDMDEDVRSNIVENAVLPDPIKNVYLGEQDVDGKIVDLGDELVYTITVENPYTEAKEFVITDKIPETIVLQEVNDGGVEQDGVITWNVTIPALSEKTVSFKVLTTLEGAVMSNVAKVSVDGEIRELETNETKTWTSITPEKAVYQGEENVDGLMVANDSDLRYVITVTNPSDFEKEYRVEDMLPYGTTFISAAGGRVQGDSVVFERVIEPNSTDTFEFVVRTSEDGNIIPNIAEVTIDESFTTTNMTLNYTPHIVTGDLVTVYKSSNPESGSKVVAGQEITYKLLVKNTSEYPTHNTVISDPIPEEVEFVSATNGGTYKDGVVTWTIDEIASFGQKEVSFKVRVKDVDDAVIRNNALYGTNEDIVTESKKTNEVVHSSGEAINPPVLSLEKETSVIGLVQTDDILTYTFTLRNNGGTVSKDNAIVDYLPDQVEFVNLTGNGAYNSTDKRVEWFYDELQPGQEVKVTVDVKVVAKEGTIFNYGYFGNNIPEEELPNTIPENSSNIVENPIEPPYVPVEVVGDYVTVRKSSDPGNGAMVKVGDIITYTLTVKNTGVSTSGKTTIQDTIYEKMTYVEGSATGGATFDGSKLTWTMEGLKPQEERTVSFKVKVNQVNKALLRNHAVYSTDTDKVKGNKNTNEIVHTVGELKLPALLSMDKKADKIGAVKTGDEITYTLVLTNVGGAVSKDTVIVEPIPEGTDLVSAEGARVNGRRVEWYIGDLEAGKSITKTIKVKVTAKKGEIDNQALFGNGIPQNELSSKTPNNKSNIVQNWLPVDPVKTIKTLAGVVMDGKKLTGGSTYYYEITVENPTRYTQTIELTDKLPSVLKFIEANEGGKMDNGTLSWTLKVDAGKTKTVRIKFSTPNDVVSFENKAQMKMLDATRESNVVKNNVEFHQLYRFIKTGTGQTVMIVGGIGILAMVALLLLKKKNSNNR